MSRYQNLYLFQHLYKACYVSQEKNKDSSSLAGCVMMYWFLAELMLHSNWESIPSLAV